MLTLKVHGQFITWPDDFANMMMKYYRIHGIPFTVHANSVNPGWDATVENTSLAKVEGAV